MNEGNSGRRLGVAGAAGLMLAAVTMSAEADEALITRGKAAFEARCGGSCHGFEVTNWGPSLIGLFGRVAGSADFPYSRVFQEADFAWTPDILDSYIEIPRLMLPGNNMAFYGLDDAEERRAIVAYLVAVNGYVELPD